MAVNLIWMLNQMHNPVIIRNVSYNNKEIKTEIINLVGKSYSLMDRFKMGGIGSPRFVISESSTAIQLLLNKDNYINYCNIEIRPGGIIVGFRSILETYGWVIPFNKLVIEKSAKHHSIHSNKDFIKFTGSEHSLNSFMQKLRKAIWDYNDNITITSCSNCNHTPD